MYGMLVLCAAVAETTSTSEVVYESWWVQIIPVVLTVLVAAITYGLKKFSSYIVEKMKASDTEKEAIQCLLQGMAKSQEEIVREAKKASEDGKLTKEEIELAKKTAITHALDVAKGPAKDLLVTMGSERLGSIIKQLLAKLSSKEKKE